VSQVFFGKVKVYFVDKRYGFITQDRGGKDMFFYLTAGVHITDGASEPRFGDIDQRINEGSIRTHIEGDLSTKQLSQPWLRGLFTDSFVSTETGPAAIGTVS
jgi:hypothetical protein